MLGAEYHEEARVGKNKKMVEKQRASHKRVGFFKSLGDFGYGSGGGEDSQDNREH